MAAVRHKKVGTVKICRFEDAPEFDLKNEGILVNEVQVIRLSYSKSTERDFETQVPDPLHGVLFLIEKDGF